MIKKTINLGTNFTIMLILSIYCDVELSENEKLNKKILMVIMVSKFQKIRYLLLMKFYYHRINLLEKVY